MSFLIYFFVLLVSAASVLFGLDLMSSPLPNTPNVPIGRSVQVASPPLPRQREARTADERALTPVYPAEPAEPGKPKVQAETSGAGMQEQAKLTPPPAPAATPAASVAQTPLPQPAPEAKTEPVVTAQPGTQQASSSCNVQACGAAYYSFRAADCSYQPAAGPRRACTMVPGATTAMALAPKPPARQLAGKDDMRAAERIVRHQPLQLMPSASQTMAPAEMSESERIVRRMTRNESGDIPVQDGQGNIIIVRKSYR